MADHEPTWLDEPYPLDHSITWREHLARKQERIDYEDRTEALGYLNDPNMYAHTDVANMVSASLGYRVSEKTVSGWRQRNL